MESTSSTVTKDEEVLNLVPENWRDEFARFLANGEGSPEFLNFLDTDPAGQHAVDTALSQRAEGFDRFTEEMKGLLAPKTLPERLATDLSSFAALPERKQKQLAKQIADSLRSLDQPLRNRMKELIGGALTHSE